MDIKCATCGEPWDTYHLREDAIFEAVFDGGLWLSITNSVMEHEKQVAEIRRKWFKQHKCSVKNSDIRKAFKNVGYEFVGDTVYSLKRCPCCPAEKKPDPEQVMKMKIAEQLMPGDQDGIASTLAGD